MKINIGRPLSFSEIGQKENQEDFVFPSPSDVRPEDRVFILCDGMGGHSKGEVASRTVATALGNYFRSRFPSDGRMTKELFNDGLKYAYSQLDLVDDGAAKKMGTTLVFVCIHKGGCFCAHIGDSRIYIVRPSERRIIYRSEDHSLVNDLIRAGEITPEEAASYPHKNVITRAIQPNSDKPVKAEIRNIEDIHSGDFVFLCCDGILENLTDEKLVSILSNPGDVPSKLAAIKNVCLCRTRDNFTCYLIPIESVETDIPQINKPALTGSRSSDSLPPKIAPDSAGDGQNKFKHFLFSKHSVTLKGWVWLAVICILLLLFLAAAVRGCTRGQQSSQDNLEQPIGPDESESPLRIDPRNNDDDSSAKSPTESSDSTIKF